MGSATSTHEPLDRNGPSPFKRHASCRGTKGEKRGSPKRMDRLRRSFRDSFRRRKEHLPESSKPHLWQADEAAVRAGTCTFQVKYLGCVEVFESRGMQVCEEALKVLRNSRRRPVKAVLFVSGDGLRVVEDETKGLIVDQTIEKVSFCAPDRNHEKGFSYICRDGTTRRWMCHGFIALKESGERLSHAVGCAFAACLERKQRREKECGVTMSFDPANSTFTRQGSFRAQTITERIADANKNNITVPTTEAPPLPTKTNAVTTVTPKPAITTHAIERPHATVSMLVRQGSFRGFNHLNQTSPFKRQLSLRISDLPSNLERTRSHSLEGGTDPRHPPLIHLKTPGEPFERERLDSISELPPPSERQRHLSLPTKIQTDEVRPPNRLRLYSLPTKVIMSPIPETSPLADRTDPVSAMCQQLSQGLKLLSNADDLLPFPNNFGNKNLSNLSKELFPLNNNSTQQENVINESTGKGGVLTPPATPSASPIPAVAELPRPEQWLGKVAAGVVRPMRAHSLDSDPFESDWISDAIPTAAPVSTNPFVTSATPGPVKAFEVHM